MNPPPGAVQSPLTVVEVHGPPRREVVRQMSPRTPAAIEVEHGIEHFSKVYRPRPTPKLRRRNQRLDQSPLTVRHVRRVKSPFHNPYIGSLTLLLTHVLSGAIVGIFDGGSPFEIAMGGCIGGVSGVIGMGLDIPEGAALDIAAGLAGTAGAWFASAFLSLFEFIGSFF